MIPRSYLILPEWYQEHCLLPRDHHSVVTKVGAKVCVFFVFASLRPQSCCYQQVGAKGYVGLGFSPNGGMKGADIILGWVDTTGAVLLQVSHLFLHSGHPLLCLLHLKSCCTFIADPHCSVVSAVLGRGISTYESLILVVSSSHTLPLFLLILFYIFK